MKKAIILFFLLIPIVLPAQQIMESFLKAYVVYPKRPEIRKYQKLELGIIPTEKMHSLVKSYFKGRDGVNPYDPDQISLEAKFIHQLSGDTNTVYGFYHREYSRDKDKGTWKELYTVSNWRIRFAPDKEGVWEAIIKVTSPKITEIMETNFTFKCVPSDNKGYLIKGDKGDLSDRYLRFSDKGAPFFGVGETIGWSSYEKPTPESYDQIKKWIGEFVQEDGNFVRLWMLPGAYTIEHKKVGDYDDHQINAWELDRIFELAEEQDFFIQLLMFINEWCPEDNWEASMRWSGNPYKRGLNLGEIIDFFENEEAKRFAKNRLRYIAARWGYSTNLAVYEYMSEPEDEVSYDENLENRKIYLDWVKEMDEYMKNELGDMGEHVTCLSFKESGGNHREEAWVHWDIDIPSFNQYGQKKGINYLDRYSLVINTQKLNPNKPYVFSEMGANSTPTLDYCSDISLHNGIWAVSMMGVCASTPYWWWDNAIHLKGYQSNFKALNAFFSEESLHKYKLKPNQWHNRMSLKRADLEVFYLRDGEAGKVIGWVHNTDYWWANYYHENECIRKAIDDKTGTHVDKNDTHDYSKNLKVHKLKKPQPLEGKKVVIKGLHSKTNYTIRWYRTTGDGGEIKELKTTVRSKASGNLKFIFPQSEKYSEGDYAFKIQASVKLSESGNPDF